MEQVHSGDDLYRRIFWYHLRDDGSISSSAFKDKKKKPARDCSVYLARLTTQDKVKQAGPAYMGMVLLAASVPLSLDLTVGWTPQSSNPDEVGYAHCTIELETQEQCDRLAEKARLICHPAKPSS